MYCPNDDTLTELNLDRIIEALEHHRRDITAGIAAFQQIREWLKPKEVAGSTTVASHGGTLRPTEFVINQPLAANIYAIMRQVGRPMTSADLESALRACGVTSRSEDFQNTLCSVMRRKKDTFVPVAPKTWALVEWAGRVPNPPPMPAASNVAPLVPTHGWSANAAPGFQQ